MSALPATRPRNGDKPAGPRSAKGAKTRARLVQAAESVFAEDGFLDARISDIAKAAGVSHGSFYHYFDSKEEVFREVAESVEQRLTAPLTSVVLDPDSEATAPERLREAFRRYLRSYKKEARIIGVIEQVSRYDAEVGAHRYERHRRYVKQVAASIALLQHNGLADPEIDPEIAAAGLGAMANRFVEMWLVQGVVDCSFELGLDQLTKMFVNALGLVDEPLRTLAGKTS